MALRCDGRLIVIQARNDVRRTPPERLQNFFELCQSAASILLDALLVPGSVQVRDGGRGMAARVDAFRTGGLSVSLAVSLVLLNAAVAAAQALAPQPKPATGFVSTFEVMRTVRAAGFDPLVPPLREGTTYVLRATDFRGILMRVVLDARTGAIRDVTRIVSAAPGALGMMPPPYRAPPGYASPPYGSPNQFDAPAAGMGPAQAGAPGQLSQPANVPAATTSTHAQFPPLPRPRPGELASQKPDDSTVAPAGAAPNGGTNSGTTVAIQPGAKPATKSEATATVPTSAPAAPGKTQPVVPPIND